MSRNKLLAAVFSAAVALTAVPAQTAADDTVVHKVTVIDLNGSVVSTISVPDGGKLDLSSIDTSRFGGHTDQFTQIGFSSWTYYPDAITEDITVYALYVKRVLSLDQIPKKSEYYVNSGKLDLTGLRVSITSYTQTPEKDAEGKYIVNTEVADITDFCTAQPADLDTAFANGRAATVNIYPIESSKSIYTYNIDYYPELGDVNMDGKVNSADASEVLTFYSIMSTGSTPDFKDDQKRRCNVDHNATIDAKDATEILVHYSQISTGGSPDWNI